MGAGFEPDLQGSPRRMQLQNRRTVHPIGGRRASEGSNAAKGAPPVNLALTVSGLTAGAFLLALGLINGEPVRTGAALELQTGPVIVAIAAPDHPLRLVAQENCLATPCPAIELRVRRAGPAEAQNSEAAERVHLTTP